MNSARPGRRPADSRAGTARLLTLALLLLFLQSCSPAYVFRAGVEEAQILWRRKPITGLLKDQTLDAGTREKFELVLAARDFAAAHQMKSRGSFAQFSSIDRDVLSWILSASKKTSFELETWWFPIVGTVPYKGFFEKADGIAEARKLQSKDLDVTLRPALAYSTLGWFDDPLLSTTMRVDQVALVETVLHEIFHNTAWVKGRVDFNESAANAIGQIGAAEFFNRRGDEVSQARGHESMLRWQDEVELSRALATLKSDLSRLYESPATPEEKLAQRLQIFAKAEANWARQAPQLGTRRLVAAFRGMNNASLLGNELYLKHCEAFDALYRRAGSFQAFLDALVEIANQANTEGKDPFELLNQYLDNS